MKKLSENDISLDGSLFSVIDTPGKTDNADRTTGQILSLADRLYESVKYFRKYSKKDEITEAIRVDELHQFVRFTLVQFKLDHRWAYSIMALVLNDILPIPTKEVVEVDIPEENYGIDFPLTFMVRVNRRMSLASLSRQISKHAELKEYLDNLPDSEPPEIQENALKWGCLVWNFKEFVNPNASIQQIIDRVDEQDMPDRATLTVYYKRFLAAKDKHKPRL